MTYLIIGIGLALVAGIVFLYLPYRPDIQAAYHGLETLPSHLVTTSHGPLQYGVHGEGHPVLFIHGNAGGFDQGLHLGADHIGDGFMGIAPSRFGYLGTPLPEGATPAIQADAFVELLDALNIEGAAVMAWSAGGASAVQLALRHPERVAALVLVSTAISDEEGNGVALPPEPILRRVFRSDFLFWLLTHPLRGIMQRMFVPASYQLTPADEAVFSEAMAKTLPMRPRAEGAVFDTYVSNFDPSRRADAYHLETLQVPTLVVNAVDDPAADYQLARKMSERIPGAVLVTIPSGGHLMLGHGERVRAAIDDFLRAELGMAP